MPELEPVVPEPEEEESFAIVLDFLCLGMEVEWWMIEWRTQDIAALSLVTPKQSGAEAVSLVPVAWFKRDDWKPQRVIAGTRSQAAHSKPSSVPKAEMLC